MRAKIHIYYYVCKRVREISVRMAVGGCILIHGVCKNSTNASLGLFLLLKKT